MYGESETQSAAADAIRITVASVGEVMGGQGILSPEIQTRVPGSTIIGPAVTCRTVAGANLALHRALGVAEPGDVIVVTAIGPAATGLWGGMATRSAVAKKVAGVIAGGGVRDTRDIRELGFPVWSAFVSPRGAGKHSAGDVNVPVVCGGVQINPGDIVVADDDGVAVIPVLDADAVLARAREREMSEAAAGERLDRGESTIDVLGLPKEE